MPPHPHPPRYQHFKLYGYWKSSSTWRVRIGLAAKKIAYETCPINIFQKGEQQQQQNISWYRSNINALGQVPVLEFWDITHQNSNGGKGKKIIRLSQSIAILLFLDEAFPEGPSLFPRTTLTKSNDYDDYDDVNDVIIQKAIAHQMIEVINSGTQPLQNLPFLMKLEEQSQGNIVATKVAKEVVERGLKALEQMVFEHHQQTTTSTSTSNNDNKYCLGTTTPTAVEAFLVPQMANARRLGVDVQQICPTLDRIDQLCSLHVWFQQSHPNQQPDAGT